MFECAADEKNVVCKPEDGEVRVAVVLRKSDYVLVSVPLFSESGFIMY